MALFVAVLAPGLTHITCRPIRTILILVSVSITIPIIVLFLIGLTRLGCIDSGGRGGAFSLSLPLIISATVFLSRRALAEDSEWLERCDVVDDSGLWALDFSTQGSFIDWPWLLPWLLALVVVVLADREPRGQC